MFYNIYSIRDCHTGFMSPTFDQNDSSAARNFRHAAASKETLLNSHPNDFQLYCIGRFDSETGQITPELPRVVEVYNE